MSMGLVQLHSYLGNTLFEASLKERSERMGLISWLIIGLIAGVIGKLVMPGDQRRR